MFGDWLESSLTGAQIDEVMVMDGSDKRLDVLSVVSDEAGMNHPSGATGTWRCSVPGHFTLHSTSVPPSLYLFAC